VDAAGNNHAARMLMPDVDNLRTYFGRFAPELLREPWTAVTVEQMLNEPHAHRALQPDRRASAAY
jgi:hypothetical protein